MGEVRSYRSCVLGVCLGPGDPLLMSRSSQCIMTSLKGERRSIFPPLVELPAKEHTAKWTEGEGLFVLEPSKRDVVTCIKFVRRRHIAA